MRVNVDISDRLILYIRHEDIYDGVNCKHGCNALRGSLHILIQNCTDTAIILYIGGLGL